MKVPDLGAFASQGTKLAIGLGLSLAVVIPFSLALWLLRQRKSPSNGKVTTNVLINSRAVAPLTEDGAHDEKPSEEAYRYELKLIHASLRELRAGLGRLQDDFPTYAAKNLAWAIVGVVLGLVAQELWTNMKPVEPPRPNFVDFDE